ncbi:Hypothetical protein PHPALM_19812 [Phytophthora palmivora]|uniref:Uncharacterized protein n=1 Tax=Phytophthora palmivora TaxID=4796 RepID=A0A2P4XGG4_9STRA|nr:Hypothetical protein PHPALM_19812 [Phytophthora palmivora]
MLLMASPLRDLKKSGDKQDLIKRKQLTNEARKFKSWTLKTSPSPATFDAAARQAPRTGYSNLVSHVQSQHQDFEEVMHSAAPTETGTLVPLIRRRSLNLFGWLRWTVMPAFLRKSRNKKFDLEPIGKEPFLDGMTCVVQHVKMTMRSE